MLWDCLNPFPRIQTTNFQTTILHNYNDIYQNNFKAFFKKIQINCFVIGQQVIHCQIEKEKMMHPVRLPYVFMNSIVVDGANECEFYQLKFSRYQYIYEVSTKRGRNGMETIMLNCNDEIGKEHTTTVA